MIGLTLICLILVFSGAIFPWMIRLNATRIARQHKMDWNRLRSGSVISKWHHLAIFRSVLLNKSLDSAIHEWVNWFAANPHPALRETLHRMERAIYGWQRVGMDELMLTATLRQCLPLWDRFLLAIVPAIDPIAPHRLWVLRIYTFVWASLFVVGLAGLVFQSRALLEHQDADWCSSPDVVELVDAWHIKSGSNDAERQTIRYAEVVRNMEHIRVYGVLGCLVVAVIAWLCLYLFVPRGHNYGQTLWIGQLGALLIWSAPFFVQPIVLTTLPANTSLYVGASRGTLLPVKRVGGMRLAALEAASVNGVRYVWLKAEDYVGLFDYYHSCKLHQHGS